MIGRWLGSFGSGAARPLAAPLTLARAWTRFTYTFPRIRDGLRHCQTLYLGVLVHRTLIAFLHALGVEVLWSRDAPLTSPRISGKPVTSGEAFAALLALIRLRGLAGF